MSVEQQPLHTAIQGFPAVLQVYVASDSLAEWRRAAHHAFQQHCQGVHAGEAFVQPTTVLHLPGEHAPEGQWNVQLAMVKPCAWPLALTAPDYAHASRLSTMLRDVSLVEAYASQLAAACMASQPQQLDILSQMLTAQHAKYAWQGLPANMLQAAVTGQPLHALQPTSGVWLDGSMLEQVVRHLWAAAACYAERAVASDTASRLQLVSALASQHQVTVWTHQGRCLLHGVPAHLSSMALMLTALHIGCVLGERSTVSQSCTDMQAVCILLAVPLAGHVMSCSWSLHAISLYKSCVQHAFGRRVILMKDTSSGKVAAMLQGCTQVAP